MIGVGITIREPGIDTPYPRLWAPGRNDGGCHGDVVAALTAGGLRGGRHMGRLMMAASGRFKSLKQTLA